MLKEIIEDAKITLKRPETDFKMAEAIFSCVAKCRETFLPWLGWVKYTNSPNDSLDFLKTLLIASPRFLLGVISQKYF